MTKNPMGPSNEWLLSLVMDVDDSMFGRGLSLLAGAAREIACDIVGAFTGPPRTILDIWR